tara:strand:+ start:1015 stop:2343 length:1329 start_codon:yes stop_codon:yes gene_type:complete
MNDNKIIKSLSIANIDDNLLKNKSYLKENIKNIGNRNCGILPYKNYMLKCQKNLTKFNVNNKIKEYFPEFYRWNSGDFQKRINNNFFYVMEKLDGDLSEYLLQKTNEITYGNKHEINFKTNSEQYLFFYDYLNKIESNNYETIYNSKSTYILTNIILVIYLIVSIIYILYKIYNHDSRLNFYDIIFSTSSMFLVLGINSTLFENYSLKNMYSICRSKLFQIKNDTNIKVFNKIKNKMKKVFSNLVKNLQPEIIKLHHNLIKNNYEYRDLKFDNIGYKIINGKIKLYFLDIESGLFKIHNNELYESWNDYMDKYQLTICPSEYGFLGGGNSNIKSMIDFKYSYINLDKIIEEIKSDQDGINFSVINRNDEYRYIQIKLNQNMIQNNFDFFCIQVCTFYLRLVRFDKNTNHPSNLNYDQKIEPIDELFQNINELILKLRSFCHN